MTLYYATVKLGACAMIIMRLVFLRFIDNIYIIILVIFHRLCILKIDVVLLFGIVCPQPRPMTEHVVQQQNKCQITSCYNIVMSNI